MQAFTCTRTETMTKKLLAPALAVLTAAAALHAPPAAAQLRNEVALEWWPGGLASDGRRSRDVSYSREFGNGWALGGSLGYGNVVRAKESDGFMALVHVRWRHEPGLPGNAWLRPQAGLVYGGTSSIFSSSDLAALFAGVYMAASPELGFTVDYIAGRAHFEGSSGHNERRDVGAVRLGLAVRF